MRTRLQRMSLKSCGRRRSFVERVLCRSRRRQVRAGSGIDVGEVRVPSSRHCSPRRRSRVWRDYLDGALSARARETICRKRSRTDFAFYGGDLGRSSSCARAARDSLLEIDGRGARKLYCAVLPREEGAERAGGEPAHSYRGDIRSLTWMTATKAGAEKLRIHARSGIRTVARLTTLRRGATTLGECATHSVRVAAHCAASIASRPRRVGHDAADDQRLLRLRR